MASMTMSIEKRNHRSLIDVSQRISFSFNGEEGIQSFIIGFRDGNLTKIRINPDDDPGWV